MKEAGVQDCSSTDRVLVKVVEVEVNVEVEVTVVVM